jgi:hypothetical protein
MTSGSRLEMVSSPRSVGGFHNVRACSGVFLAIRWAMLELVLGVTTLRDMLCFTAKFLWWPIWAGYLVPYSDLGPVVVKIREQGALPGSILSQSVRMVGDAVLGGAQPPTLDACESADCLSTCITDFYIEYWNVYPLWWGGGVLARICVSLNSDGEGTEKATRGGESEPIKIP